MRNTAVLYSGMIECIFTIDYELYGNGEGSLKELVLEPGWKLKSIFESAAAKLVLFVEAVELEKIASCRSDPCISEVEHQVRDFYEHGHEIALHLHPQWCNARFESGKWNLDFAEYNLCSLPPARINWIVGNSIEYLRRVLGDSSFTPFSFRAGNWLFQPTATAANVLAEHGVKVDSSVFKGGVQRRHGLDYRPSAKNGLYWNFRDDVNVPAPNGALLELPIHTQMVPFWRMATGKRIALQRKASANRQPFRDKFYRMLDFARFRQPRKFDFCRMTREELVSMLDRMIQADKGCPGTYKPLVAIGHTKDLLDFEVVEFLLNWLKANDIPVSTLQRAYTKCVSQPLVSWRSTEVVA